MNTHPNQWQQRATGVALISLMWMAHSAGATLEDFGYNHIKVNGQEARGHRPLLVIVVNFAGSPALAHDNAYYDDFVFNFFNTNGVNGYYLENSNARFFWSRASSGIYPGMIGPLDLPARENRAAFNGLAPGGQLGEELFVSNIVYKAMTTTSFNFGDFDANADRTVTADELGILIISNDRESSGANRWTHNVTNGTAVAVNMHVGPGGLAEVSHREGINLIAHEMSHSLGTLDLYGSGNLSENLSLMAGRDFDLAAIVARNDTYHLDPWHKMALSWSEPRIRSFRDGGKVVLPAAQLTQADGPVILYDPLRDPNEFFMLEYRTPASPLGSGFDRNVAGSGLVIWHIQQDTSKNPVRLKDLAHGPYPGQGNWWWCQKCQGLSYAVSPSFGSCPAGGSHTNFLSGYYSMVNWPTAPGQHNWRYCHKCQGLFLGDNEPSSVCPTGGTHEGAGSFDYSLVADSPDAAGQPAWRWCHKCQGLFFGANQALSVCPTSGNHDGSLSGNYRMVWNSPDAYAVFTEGAPDLQHGGRVVWGSGVTTPNLRWLDTTEMPVKLYVHPFSPGDGSITVEWLRDETYWVDFAYPGGFFFPEFGTFINPFNTLAEGVTAVPHGGTINLKTGSSSETASVAKRVRLQAYGGPVTIGR